MERTCCVDVWLIGDPKTVFFLIIKIFLARITRQYFRINVLEILITSKFKRLGLTGNLGKPIWVAALIIELRFTSVKLGLIAIFLLDDRDYLLAVTTAPHQSYRNWVEMIMSTFNLALQTVAICRSTMSADMEQLHILKSLSIMEAIIQKLHREMTVSKMNRWAV